LIDQYPARYRSSNALVYVTGIKPAVYFVAMTISSLLPGLCTIHSETGFRFFGLVSVGRVDEVTSHDVELVEHFEGGVFAALAHG
jgi:hypothetical protein